MADPIAAAAAPGGAPARLIDLRNLIWVGLALVAMVAAIESDRRWYLEFVHVLAGLLWTGIDLFMGFVVGPAIRRLDLEARRAVISRLLPKMLFLMPTLAIVTTTAGWFLAERTGFLSLPFPQLWWVVAALAVVAILVIQGLFILLPTNVRVLLEIGKPAPDFERIGDWMRIYVLGAASQAAMQVAIIVIMTRFATGI